MPSPEGEEYAFVLLRRSENDAEALRVLAEAHAVGDEILGFHAQQAVEKALKAVLVSRTVEFPRTHDLDFLLDVASQAGIAVPPEIVDSSWLTPWAAQLRYDAGDAPLDHARAIAAATFATAWARSAIQG